MTTSRPTAPARRWVIRSSSTRWRQVRPRGRRGAAGGGGEDEHGHLEGAAGIAGFIKAVWRCSRADSAEPELRAMESGDRRVPTRLFVPTDLAPWPCDWRPAAGGGVLVRPGGTNAHVVLEQGPDAAPVSVGRGFGGDDAGGLGQDGRAGGVDGAVLADWMEATAPCALADVAHTLNHHRSRYATFATVCA